MYADFISSQILWFVLLLEMDKIYIILGRCALITVK